MAEHKRVALITGANKGIGLEVARGLGRAGLTVLVGARDPKAGRAAAAALTGEGLDARFVELDLARTETMAAAATAIEGEFGRLDVLVNNAGIVVKGDGPPSTADLAAVRQTFETNLFGTAAVVQAMVPLLRRSASPRVVNVSSGLGSLALNSDPDGPFKAIKPLGYNASKAALNMLTVQLAWEFRDMPAAKVNAADPGYTATDLNGHSGPQTVEEGAAETIRLALLADDGPTGGFFETAGPRAW